MTRSTKKTSSESLRQQLDEARQAATAAISETEATLSEAQSAMDGTAPRAMAVSQAEDALSQLQAWHGERIASLEQEHAQALESEAEHSRESEARAFFGALLARRETLSGDWKALKALTKAAEKVLDQRGALGLAVPSETPAHVLERLPGYVAELPEDHPLREAFEIATQGVRSQRQDINRRKTPRQVEQLQVSPFAALSLPVRGLGDDEGLALLVDTERTIRGLADALATGIGRVRRLRSRHHYQTEDREDDLALAVRAELSQEREARLSELRAQFIDTHPRFKPDPTSGKLAGWQRDEVEQLAQEAYTQELGGTVAAQESARARVAERVNRLLSEGSEGCQHADA